MSQVCSHRHVRMLDNFVRPLIHNPVKLFGAYLQPGMSALDIGCGGGFAAIGMARLVGDEGHVVAADVQLEMLSFVQKRSRKAGLERVIKTHLCDPDDLNLAGGFDFVNAFYMVHETPDSASLLDQVRARLKQNGNFFIAEPRFHVSRQRFEQLIKRARRSGFVVEKTPKVRFSLAAILRAA